MIGKWGFSLLPFYLGIIPIFANNNYTLTQRSHIYLKNGIKDSINKYVCEYSE